MRTRCRKRRSGSHGCEPTFAAVACEAAGAAAEDAPVGERTALGQLTLLSQLLLQFDPQATMDVARVSDDTFEVRSISLKGHVLQDFGAVTAETNVRHIATVCKHAAIDT